jgi:ABC-type antimicrobial peptide transport system permease subunit
VFWPAFYVPLSQFPEESAGQPSWAGYLLIATRGLAATRGGFENHPLVVASERASRSISVQRVDRFADLMIDEYTLSRLRTNMFFLSMMATIALTLSMASVAGMMLENVRQQTRALGIRLAIGATPRRLMTAMGWGACRLAIASGGAGAVAAAVGSGLISSVFFGGGSSGGLFLFGRKPTDVLILGLGGSALIALVGLVALLTVRRIATIDPVIALRAE